MARAPGERFFRPTPQAEVDEELEFHLEERVREYVAGGMEPEAARAAALARLGDLPGVRRRCAELLAAERRAEARRDWLSDLRQDLRFGVRSALRAPVFSLLAIVTLALGIGANAAVFGVVESVLLDSLPYADADRLVRVYSLWRGSDSDRQSVSPGAANDVAARMDSFAAATAFNFSTFDVTHLAESGPRVLTGALVDGAFFATLGVEAALGRTLVAEDAAGAVVLLGHAAWQREMGGDRAAVGRTFEVNGTACEVVGVLPAGFVGPMGEADVWLALDLAPILADAEAARGQHWLGVVARLDEGVGLDAAHAELDALGETLAREHPASDAGRDFRLVPLRESMVGDTRTPLLLLMASAALVLLVACANLAGALLSRILARRREVAVRVALGARGGRMIRQLLTESTLLALAGALLGLGLARLALEAVARLELPQLPAYTDLSLDLRVVAATALAALLTGVAFGISPALAASRWQPQHALRDATRGTSEGRLSRRFRGALVAGQIALSLGLLTGAALLVRGLWAIADAPLGFEAEGVLVAGVQLPSSAYPTSEEAQAFYRRLEERLAAQPGVERVAVVTQLPSPQMSSNFLTLEGRPPEGDEKTFIPYMSVSDGYFGLMGIELRQGRLFGPEDGPQAPPAIVVSETFARRYWPEGGAVGRRLRVSPHTAERWGTIVGVVADVRMDPAVANPEPLAYATDRQDFSWLSRTVLVRAEGDPLALVRPAERTLAALDPALPLRHPRSLRSLVDERFAGRSLPVLLLSAFGVLALLLASVGVYALFDSLAAARERELGVRLALGASRGAVAGLVLKQGGAWMAAGLAGGLAGLLLVARLLGGLAEGVPALDPLAVGAAVAALVACASLALVGPVRRSTRVDPATALRS